MEFDYLSQYDESALARAAREVRAARLASELQPTSAPWRSAAANLLLRLAARLDPARMPVDGSSLSNRPSAT